MFHVERFNDIKVMIIMIRVKFVTRLLQLITNNTFNTSSLIMRANVVIPSKWYIKIVPLTKRFKFKS